MKKSIVCLVASIGVSYGSGLANFIETFEGFESTAKPCPAGYETIGFGHKLEAGEKFGTLSRDQAVALLQRDIVTRGNIRPHITVDLEPHQYDALTSIAFNCGVSAIAQSTLLEKVNNGELTESLEHFGHWRKGGGKILNGLVKRRFAEAFLFADKVMDPDGPLPSQQWGMPMAITDENWDVLRPAYKQEAVRAYSAYHGGDSMRGHLY